MRKSQQKRSFLIVRLGAIGDVVMSSPVAHAIKRHNPNARIYWVVQPEIAPLLEGNPYIDEIILWDKRKWKALWKEKKLRQLWQELKQFRAKLRSLNFDTALDLQGLMKSGLITWLSGARYRIGLGSKEGSGWFMTKTISRNLGGNTPIGSEYRYLINQLGMPDTPWEMCVTPPPTAERNALNILKNNACTENYAVICPFTTRPQKHWFDEYWQQVALRIRGRHLLKTVILGGPDDAEQAAQMARGCGAVNLAGKTSLQEASAIIKHASLLIGVDTGLTHMGHAYKIPTVALFGSTCPYFYAGVETSKVIYSDRMCSPCRRRPTCGGQFDCMRDITPDMVLTEIKRLLKIKSENSDT